MILRNILKIIVIGSVIIHQIVISDVSYHDSNLEFSITIYHKRDVDRFATKLLDLAIVTGRYYLGRHFLLQKNETLTPIIGLKDLQEEIYNGILLVEGPHGIEYVTANFYLKDNLFLQKLKFDHNINPKLDNLSYATQAIKASQSLLGSISHPCIIEDKFSILKNIMTFIAYFVIILFEILAPVIISVYSLAYFIEKQPVIIVEKSKSQNEFGFYNLIENLKRPEFYALFKFYFFLVMIYLSATFVIGLFCNLLGPNLWYYRRLIWASLPVPSISFIRLNIMINEFRKFVSYSHILCETYNAYYTDYLRTRRKGGDIVFQKRYSFGIIRNQDLEYYYSSIVYFNAFISFFKWLSLIKILSNLFGF